MRWRWAYVTVSSRMYRCNSDHLRFVGLPLGHFNQSWEWLPANFQALFSPTHSCLFRLQVTGLFTVSCRSKFWQLPIESSLSSTLSLHSYFKVRLSPMTTVLHDLILSLNSGSCAKLWSPDHCCWDYPCLIAVNDILPLFPTCHRSLAPSQISVWIVFRVVALRPWGLDSNSDWHPRRASWHNTTVHKYSGARCIFWGLSDHDIHQWYHDIPGHHLPHHITDDARGDNDCTDHCILQRQAPFTLRIFAVTRRTTVLLVCQLFPEFWFLFLQLTAVLWLESQHVAALWWLWCSWLQVFQLLTVVCLPSHLLVLTTLWAALFSGTSSLGWSRQMARPSKQPTPRPVLPTLVRSIKPGTTSVPAGIPSQCAIRIAIWEVKQ